MTAGGSNPAVTWHGSTAQRRGRVTSHVAFDEGSCPPGRSRVHALADQCVDASNISDPQAVGSHPLIVACFCQSVWPIMTLLADPHPAG